MNVKSGKFDKELLRKKFEEYKSSGSVKLRNEIIEMNIPLVAFIVSTQFNDIGVEYSELNSLGYFGLIKAVEKYNLELNVEFSTFAVKCILHAIIRGIHTVVDVGDTKNAYYMLRSISMMERESCILLKDDLDEIYDIIAMFPSVDMDIMERILNYFLAKRSIIIDASFVLEREVEEDAINTIMSKMAYDEMCNLPAELREILKLRFGFYGKCYTYVEIADMFGCSRTTISKKEDKAISMLRSKVL